MTEDEKMFHIGVWMLGIVALITVAVQVCYRTQIKARNRTRAEIVRTQQEIAASAASFASYVRPEILRNMVTGVYPRSESIGFNKSVSISDLPES